MKQSRQGAGLGGANVRCAGAALVAAATGDVVERYMYDAYGKATVLDEDWTPLEGNASAVSNDVLYAGYRFDAETGLYATDNRIYHPTLGRWLQRDPAGYLDGANLYGYVSGNPAGLTDPSGLCGETAPEPAPAAVRQLAAHDLDQIVPWGDMEWWWAHPWAWAAAQAWAVIALVDAGGDVGGAQADGAPNNGAQANAGANNGPPQRNDPQPPPPPPPIPPGFDWEPTRDPLESLYWLQLLQDTEAMLTDTSSDFGFAGDMSSLWSDISGSYYDWSFGADLGAFASEESRTSGQDGQFSWWSTFAHALASNVGNSVAGMAMDIAMPWRITDRAVADYDADRLRGVSRFDAGLNAIGKNTPLVSAGWGLGEAIKGRTEGGVDNGRRLDPAERWGRVGSFVAAEAGSAAVACKIAGVNPSIAVGFHPPHHGQGWHVQINTWRPGVKGSGWRWSLP